MKVRQSVANKTSTMSGFGLFQSLFAPWFRSAPSVEAVVRLQAAVLSSLTDAGVEACWTASLHRGADLPPFRLSISSGAGSRSAMRFEPCGRRREANALNGEL